MGRKPAGCFVHLLQASAPAASPRCPDSGSAPWSWEGTFQEKLGRSPSGHSFRFYSVFLKENLHLRDAQKIGHFIHGRFEPMSCETSGKLLDFCMPVSLTSNYDPTSSYLVGLVRGLNKLIHRKFLEQCQEHSSRLINISSL